MKIILTGLFVVLTTIASFGEEKNTTIQSTAEDCPEFTPIHIAPWPIEGKCPLPKYPEMAAKAGISTKALVALRLDSVGKVADYRLLDIERDRLGFEQDLEKACRHWEFTPALNKRREPIGVWIYLPFEFQAWKTESYESYPQDSLAASNRPIQFADSIQALHEEDIYMRYIPSPITSINRPVRADFNSYFNH